jgi:membrane-associated phospholipid phosphatase
VAMTDAGWRSAALLRTLRGRAGAAYRVLPDGTVKRLLLAQTGAWIACAAVVAMMTRIGPGLLERGVDAWDRAVMLAIRDHSPVTFVNGIMLESPGNILITVPVMTLAVGLSLWRGRLTFAILLPFGYLLARLLIWEGWWLWDRPRPTMVAEGIASHSANSFPSGHILLATYVYGFLVWLWVESTASRTEQATAWLVALVVAAGVGFSRLVLGAHWPSDTIAGFVLGVLYLALSITALRYAERKPGGT